MRVRSGPRRCGGRRRAACSSCPGMVDTHVHLMDPGPTEREDFPTGTTAAAARGVTTIVEHTHGHPIRTVDDLARQARAPPRPLARRLRAGGARLAGPARPRSRTLWDAGVDLLQDLHVHDPRRPGPRRRPTCWRRSSTWRRPARRRLVHCEDEAITAARRGGPAGAGPGRPGRHRRVAQSARPSWWPRWRRRPGRADRRPCHGRPRQQPAVAELIRQRPDARRRPGGRGLPPVLPPARARSCSTEGALRKFTPPARARSDADEDAMWRLLRDGVLTHLSTDHAPGDPGAEAERRHLGRPLRPARASTRRCRCCSTPPSRGTISLEDVVRVYAEATRRAGTGCGPARARSAPGADADIVARRPRRGRVVSDDEVLSKAGLDPVRRPVGPRRDRRTWLRGVRIAGEGALQEGCARTLPAGRRRAGTRVSSADRPTRVIVMGGSLGGLTAGRCCCATPGAT